jgi:hypothetical protein
MHPNLLQDIARHRQADMLREAERARLAAAVSEAASERPYRRLRLRRRVIALPSIRPVLDS